MEERYPKILWDGATPERAVTQFARPSPEDWKRITHEVTALQEAVGIKGEWPLRDNRSSLTAFKAELNRLRKIIGANATKAKRQGLEERTIMADLPDVNANGTVDFTIFLPPQFTCLITRIAVGYITVPTSAGTIVLDIFKEPAVLLQKTAAFDIKAMVAKTLSDIPPSLQLYIQPSDFVFGTITSDNVDASAGVSGRISVTYKVFKA